MGPHAKSSAHFRRGVHVISILDSVRAIVRVLRIGSRAAEKQVGLSAAQLFVLQALSARQPLSLNELALRTRTHQSSVSVVVQRLVDRRLVSRNPSTRDARSLELSLTPAAVKLLHKAPDAVQHQLIMAIERLPERDQAGLAALLKKVVADVSPADASVPMFFEEDAARAKPPVAKTTGRRKVKRRATH